MNMESFLISSVWIASIIPAVVFLRNFFRYATTLAPCKLGSSSKSSLSSSEKNSQDAGAGPELSILIPARNEVERLPGLLEDLHQQKTLKQIEIIVLDDESDDGTGELIERYSKLDSRIRRISGSLLPTGWCGKQWACWNLALQARGEWLLFLDADVRLNPGSVDSWLESANRSGIALVSGIPRQITITFLEKLCIPLIHFVLLSFLPIWRMRRSTHPSYSAGCGQWMLARSASYHEAGGHRAIASSMHDGILLPKTFRKAGYKTDLMDLTPEASCRMYNSGKEVWEGLMKNATEGVAAPGRIVPITVILLAGQVAPWVLLASLNLVSSEWVPYVISGAFASILPRALAAWRYQQSWMSVLLHPVGILVFLAIQWTALTRFMMGRRIEWRGRGYPSSGEPVAEVEG